MSTSVIGWKTPERVGVWVEVGGFEESEVDVEVDAMFSLI